MSWVDFLIWINLPPGARGKSGAVAKASKDRPGESPRALPPAPGGAVPTASAEAPGLPDASAPNERRILRLGPAIDDAPARALARSVAAATGRQPAQIDGTDGAADAAEAPPVTTLVAATPRQLHAWLARHGPWRAGPLIGFGSAPSAEEAVALLEAGVCGWWPEHATAESWIGGVLALEEARWASTERLRRAAEDARTQLDERKWVDRAKGVLMDTGGIGERQAYELLRGAAMHASLRIGELSKSLWSSARWAETLNFAGQLRMLSQRLVSLAAQACDTPGARPLRAERERALQRVDEILHHLHERALAEAPAPAWQPLLRRTGEDSAALRDALASRASVAQLAGLDALAEAMLDSAEQLLRALEMASDRHALRIVTLCGRQRMRVQRVAKQALVARLLGDAERSRGLAPLIAEFESVLRELEQAPLSSAEIRGLLVEARDEWGALLRGLKGLDRPEDRRAVVRSSDTLLALFDKLTATYERSLQVLLA